MYSLIYCKRWLFALPAFAVTPGAACRALIPLLRRFPIDPPSHSRMHLRTWKIGAFLAVVRREKGTLLSRLLNAVSASASGASPPSPSSPATAVAEDNATALERSAALRFLQFLARLSRRVSERILNRLIPVVFFGAPVCHYSYLHLSVMIMMYEMTSIFPFSEDDGI